MKTKLSSLFFKRSNAELKYYFFLLHVIAAQPKPKRVKQPKKIRDASEYDDDAAWSIPDVMQDENDEDGENVKKEVKVCIFVL